MYMAYSHQVALPNLVVILIPQCFLCSPTYCFVTQRGGGGPEWWGRGALPRARREKSRVGGGVEGELRARTVKSKATWGRVESRARKRGGEVLGDILIVTYH